MFTKFGIPQEIQSDQGSAFTSNLFHQVINELGIDQTLSTAYHPESQGALERWHQTMKSVMRKYCIEKGKHWDEGLDFVLFALREAPQESLGCSPFEMLYGRKVRGPLRVIKEKFITPVSDKSLTVTQYLKNLRATLDQVRNLAKQNFKSAQDKMKLTFDKKAKLREFNVGDKVLAYFPVAGSPLSAKFHGPYVIERKINKVNYIITTPDRRKSNQSIHINLLKPYQTRNTEENSPINPCNVVLKELDTEERVETPPSGRPNSIILSDLGSYLYHLDNNRRENLIDLIDKYPNVFSDIPGNCTVMKHDVQLIQGTYPIRQAPYRLSPLKKQQMRDEVDYLLNNGLAVPSKSPWASPCVLVPKEGGQMRMCTDYRRVNSVTVPDSYPIPRVDDLVDSVGQSKYLSKLDLLKGYYQISLTEQARKISAFITPFGLFEYLVMPFGMRNSPATFQRIMNYLLQDIKGVYVYLDDILVISDTWSSHMSLLSMVLQKLDEAHLTVKLDKTTFGKATVTYLGHVVGQGMVRPKQANVEAILSYPAPVTRKGVMRFLGMAGYYRRFCPNFADVAAPLTHLTSGKVTFTWTSECENSFNQLKLLLTSDPVLAAPDFEKPFMIQSDASDQAVGAVLLQSDDQGVLHPVAYHSEKLKQHQLAYSTIEKELLSIISAIKKFECYLQLQPLEIYTDHNPLTFLERNKHSNQRLLRWSLILQPYTITIRHIKGKNNVIADTLSRPESLHMFPHPGSSRPGTQQPAPLHHGSSIS